MTEVIDGLAQVGYSGHDVRPVKPGCPGEGRTGLSPYPPLLGSAGEGAQENLLGLDNSPGQETVAQAFQPVPERVKQEIFAFKAKGHGMLKVKRVYEPPSPTDGERILVDRLWPRGLKKEAAHLKDWLKDLAPSDDLRHWFSHEPQRWEKFQQRYREELEDPGKKSHLEALVARARQGTVTLVFAARDEQRNNAVVLQQYLNERLGSSA